MTERKKVGSNRQKKNPTKDTLAPCYICQLRGVEPQLGVPTLPTVNGGKVPFCGSPECTEFLKTKASHIAALNLKNLSEPVAVAEMQTERERKTNLLRENLVTEVPPPSPITATTPTPTPTPTDSDRNSPPNKNNFATENTSSKDTDTDTDAPIATEVEANEEDDDAAAEEEYRRKEKYYENAVLRAYYHLSKVLPKHRLKDFKWMRTYDYEAFVANIIIELEEKIEQYQEFKKQVDEARDFLFLVAAVPVGLRRQKKIQLTARQIAEKEKAYEREIQRIFYHLSKMLSKRELAKFKQMRSRDYEAFTANISIKLEEKIEQYQKLKKLVEEAMAFFYPLDVPPL